MIDDKGNFLHPNDILVLLYYYLVKFKGWHGPVVRNIATTHMLDKVAEQFGEKCYEVPVGFKYVSAKMQETGAIIGGESSGGLTVHGHINGKDGIYAAALLIEMLAVTGKKLSQIMDDIHAECGEIHMEERDYKFTLEKKLKMQEVLIEQKQLPDLPEEIDHVSYLDGSKVYFKMEAGSSPASQARSRCCAFSARCRMQPRRQTSVPDMRSSLICRVEKRRISHSIPCLATL